MLKRLALVIAFGCSFTAAWADAKEDCADKTGDAQVMACSEVIRGDKKAAWAYSNRAGAYT